MSWWDSITGKAQQKTINAGHKASSGLLSTGYAAGRGSYENARTQYQPYQQSGMEANRLYSDAIGINGADGGARAFSAYQGAQNPFLQGQQSQTENALMRSMAQRGMSASGPALLAAARSRDEMAYGDYNNWLARVGGMQGQGLQTANALSGLDQNLANLHWQYGQTAAGNEINRASAIAQAKSQGAGNVLGLVSSIGGAMLGGITPGMSGISPLGNMMTGISGGGWR